MSPIDTPAPRATAKRSAPGTAFCQQYHESKKARTENAQITHAAYMQMIDMLFEQAGLDASSTEEQVVARLGSAGLSTVLQFYKMAQTVAPTAKPEAQRAPLARRRLSFADSVGQVPDFSEPSSASETASVSTEDDDCVPDTDRMENDSMATRRIDSLVSNISSWQANKTVFGMDEKKTISMVKPKIALDKLSLPESAVTAVPSMEESMLPMVLSPVTPVYKKDTEIAMSRIFELGKVATVANPEISPFAPYDGPSVLTMTGFGELGRWGNQILQYMFLKCAAQKTNAKIEIPYWVGSDIFNLENTTVQRRFPAVIEDRTKKANSTFTDDFMEYIRASNGGESVQEVFESAIDPNSDVAIKNVDVWGWFQWHTKQFAPHKQLIMDTFAPVKPLSDHLDKVIDEKLRNANGKKTTVVGLHLRLGDYKNIAASSFGYCAPTSWYLEWLAEIWPTLENPVLFVASDEIDTVLRDFAAYNPVTSDMIGATMPESMKAMGAGFFPDWYVLTQCDVLAISNSSFSFSACMLNKRANLRCFRAHYAHRMVEFDAWNAEPIVHREIGNNAISDLSETLRILYNTQGTRAVVKNVLVELPFYGLRSVIMKAVLQARRLTAVAAMPALENNVSQSVSA
eukprot:CAMPEP_0184706798 /NCGR_PEP_ID=MMETSP0313-20130426/36942_1 /TAXON_ID=2792 /ORGANISM="Porphyridium aerugineum, Strain SAG 1380-2" /LENGTH=627 /DNA_ID=CAMNT_0027168363 /DNA_START=826 /DNA_END=2709 /DNA_ORIENTATION=-